VFFSATQQRTTREQVKESLLSVLRSYGAAQVAAVTQAISADRCPECRAGDVPTYDEHWKAWYHDCLLCLGSTARLAAAQP
jgi:hypothetical protein